MRTLCVAFVLAALCGAPGLWAAGAEQTALAAKVPFAFAAGGALLPAGEYTVERGPVSVLFIRNTAGPHSANVMTIRAEARKERGKGALVFHKYGHRYFLREVWSPGREGGTEIRISKDEREFLQAAVPERVHIAVAAFR
jgi:hypothetical protein